MGYDFEMSGVIHRVEPVHQMSGQGLRIADREYLAKLVPALGEGAFDLELDGRIERVYVAIEGDTHYIHCRGQAHQVEALNALERAQRDAEPSGGVDALRAPMPGTVVEISVEAGASVVPGDLLLTIESMKLQTAMTASQAATVSEVCVSPGANFDQGDILIRLEPIDASDPAAETESKRHDETN